MHVGFCDVFDDDRDIIVPSTDRFVIRSSDEPSILVDECDRVDGAEMLVVFLGNLARVHIILHERFQLPLCNASLGART